MKWLMLFMMAAGLMIAIFLGVIFANNPQNAAEAERTRALAVIEAQQASQLVLQDQAAFERTQTEQAALAQQWVMWKTVIGWAFVSGFSMVIVANSGFISIISWELWRAVGMAAWLRSRQIAQDPRTGQLPAFYDNHMLTDADAGQVIDTTRPQLASGAQVRMIGDIRKTGLAARSSYRGLAQINANLLTSTKEPEVYGE